MRLSSWGCHHEAVIMRLSLCGCQWRREHILLGDLTIALFFFLLFISVDWRCIVILSFTLIPCGHRHLFLMISTDISDDIISYFFMISSAISDDIISFLMISSDIISYFRYHQLFLMMISLAISDDIFSYFWWWYHQIFLISSAVSDDDIISHFPWG